jgi:hypothetical protein
MFRLRGSVEGFSFHQGRLLNNNFVSTRDKADNKTSFEGTYIIRSTENNYWAIHAICQRFFYFYFFCRKKIQNKNLENYIVVAD